MDVIELDAALMQSLKACGGSIGQHRVQGGSWLVEFVDADAARDAERAVSTCSVAWTADLVPCALLEQLR